MTTYQWVTLGLGAFGFVLTWGLGLFKAGRMVEQMKVAIKLEIAAEKKDVLNKVEALKEQFFEEQKTQDHNFGEVGASMRQYTADVEKKQFEMEIWGRDNYVQKNEFETMRQDIKDLARSIKEDFREVFAKIDAKQ